MKFTTIAAAFALAQSVFGLRTVTLKTFAYPPPQYPEITGQFVSAQHEGAGINYLFVVPQEGAAKFVYDEDEKSLYLDPEVVGNAPYKFYFNVADGEPGFLMTGGTDKPLEVNIDNLGFVTFEGSYGVKAVKNVNDPYHYSDSSYALAKYDGAGPDGAIPVFFQAIDA
ncbi:Cell wall protein PGA31 [Candida viswanathii]|uniref:Cell wall protein PGA31 n=1 Tax=Candida viswanathii TaxID=5486 RepID=A0A367XX63_9ASCO|nr:Cell wall protein PGA31 [Candida viswanathii]